MSLDIHRKTPWEIAREWYSETGIRHYLLEQKYRPDRRNPMNKVPPDIYSEEFAKWLTNEYRLAMAKGIEFGRSGEMDR